MFALLGFFLAILWLPFKSKSRLEAENVVHRTSTDCVAAKGARLRPLYEQGSPTLYTAVSLVSVGPQGHHDQWFRAVDDAGRFLDEWAGLALDFGWGPSDIFGSDGLAWFCC